MFGSEGGSRAGAAGLGCGVTPEGGQVRERHPERGWPGQRRSVRRG